MTTKLKPSEKKHYVNNKEFLEEMIIFRNNIKAAEEADVSPPKIPDCIALKIYNICYRLSYSFTFINYSYRDEMVADGIENCIRYIRNFDPEKSSNPFSYFTQISAFAFIRRIKKEKKQFVLKAKYVQSSNLLLDMENQMDQHGAGDVDFSDEDHHKYLETLYGFDVEAYDEAQNKKKLDKEKSNKKINTLEKFL